MAALEVAADVLRQRRRARHLPRGHPVARRAAAQGPHRRRPAGADVGRADRARRPRRHRPHPADRCPGAAAVPPGRRPLRHAPRPDRLRRLAAPAPAAADRRPDGGDPPPQRPGRSATTSPAPSRRSCGAAPRACTRSTPSAAVGAIVGAGGPLRRRRRVPRVRRRSCRPPCAGSGCRVMPDGAVRFATEVDGLREVPTDVPATPPTQERPMTDSTYHVIELIGSSSDSWELAAQNAVREAAKALPGPARRRGRGDGRADRERGDHRLPHEAAPELQATPTLTCPCGREDLGVGVGVWRRDTRLGLTDVPAQHRRALRRAATRRLHGGSMRRADVRQAATGGDRARPDGRPRPADRATTAGG